MPIEQDHVCISRFSCESDLQRLGTFSADGRIIGSGKDRTLARLNHQHRWLCRTAEVV